MTSTFNYRKNRSSVSVNIWWYDAYVKGIKKVADKKSDE